MAEPAEPPPMLPPISVHDPRATVPTYRRLRPEPPTITPRDVVVGVPPDVGEGPSRTLVPPALTMKFQPRPPTSKSSPSFPKRFVSPAPPTMVEPLVPA